MKNLANLNTLRFLLAFLVILSHVSGYLAQLGINWNAAICEKGPLAVMYFFSLSGFLIIRLIHIEVIKDKFNLKNFYTRRALRILPLYFIIFFIGTLIYHVIIPALNLNLKFDYDISSMVSHFALMIPNIFVAHNMKEMGGILFVLWSIGVEIQFYLFVPLLFAAFKRRTVLALLVLFVLHVVIDYNSNILSGNFLVYYPFLFAGVITILSYEGKLDAIMKPLIVRILLLLAFIYSLLFHWDFGPPTTNNVITTVISTLFICSIADYPLYTIKDKTLNYLGDISYGLYMYHMIPASVLIFGLLRLDIVQKIGPWPTALLYLSATVAFTVLLSAISYAYFEKPLIDLKKKYRSIATA